MVKKTPSPQLRVAITRDSPGELAALLAAAGMTVIHTPLVRIELLAPAATDAGYDWLIFTSSRAVDAIKGHAPAGARVACVGDATAAHAVSRGFEVALVPERQHVKGLIEAFAALPGPRGRVLYPRSDLAPSTLKEGLSALGYSVDDRVAYRNLPDRDGMAALQAEIAELHAVSFASPSAVKYALEAVGDELKKLRLYSIGPSTSAAIREAGCEVAAEAREHSEAGLAEAIIENTRE